jgi:hypothetical protein
MITIDSCQFSTISAKIAVVNGMIEQKTGSKRIAPLVLPRGLAEENGSF